MAKNVSKNYESKKWGIAIKSLLVSMILVLVFTSVSFAVGGGRYSVDPWSFGVHGDTQWTLSSSTYRAGLHTNNAYVNGELISILNDRFIEAGVKFVIQVGDLSDRSGDAAMAERALRSQSLYDAGIGFFPLRGNHETYGALYGYDPDKNLNIPAFRSNFPQTQGLDNLFGATGVNSPAIDDLTGLSYSFNYDNATFVIVDVEQTHYITKTAPYNPQSCLDAVVADVPEGEEFSCGQGYFYYLNSWFYGYDSGLIVYQASYDILNGITVQYDSEANPIVVDGSSVQDIIIPAGEWFHIDAESGRPSTDWKTWNEANPDQMYNGAPFDIIAPVADPFNRVAESSSAAGTEYWPGTQQDWISSQLDKNIRGTDHGFVFSHRGLMGADHVDCLFGSYPGSKADTQNPFYASLEENGVKYMISGHDHLYNRALVESPDGMSEVEQLISIGASSKFYGPAALGDFFGTKGRETQISQEIDTVGYYIYTVDGPRVTVDYYADAIGNIQGDYCYPHGYAHEEGNPDDNPYRSCTNNPLGNPTTIVDGTEYPTSPLMAGTFAVTAEDFDFVKKETWGYSQNGQQFVIVQGESYTVVEDNFGATTAKVLDGTNNSTTTDLTPETPRPLNKTVNTGWVANPDPATLKSDILSLWGMSELGMEHGQTDEYVLSMSFDFNKMVHLGNGGIGIATYVDGEWVNAVDENIGGAKNFVVGKYKPGYGLGTYGVDPSTKTAWAVLDYNADFAVAMDIESVPGKRK